MATLLGATLLVAPRGAAQPAAEGENRVEMSLVKAIAEAQQNSLDALIATNSYIASYWEYRQYKAKMLPSVSLTSTPMQYYRNIVRRYDSRENVDKYRQQKSFYSSAELAASQNFLPTGGVFSLATDLSYLHSFGVDRTTQFSSVPLRLGYSQSLFGYNEFKWNRKIEPLRFSAARRQLAYEFEGVAQTATEYFFELALRARSEDLARENVERCDTAYQIATERQKIGNATRADVLTLKLTLLQYQKELEDAMVEREEAEKSLCNYLRYPPGTGIALTLPREPEQIVMVARDEAITLATELSPQMQQLKISELRSRQELDRIKKSRLATSVSMSVGFNQSGGNFADAYKKLMRQDIVSVSLSVPILDWGENKGRRIVAENELEAVVLSNRQKLEKFNQSVALAVREYNKSYGQISLCREAESLAAAAYDATFQRFLIGRGDVDALSMAQNRCGQARRNYINALAEYWKNYYKLRQLTLYDFAAHQPIEPQVAADN